jgi:hypothetical protein
MKGRHPVSPYHYGFVDQCPRGIYAGSSLRGTHAEQFVAGTAVPRLLAGGAETDIKRDRRCDYGG